MKLLTWCDLPDTVRYEVLDARCTYRTRAPFYVRFLKAGVTVNEHPFQTEIAARSSFERLVEEASHA